MLKSLEEIPAATENEREIIMCCACTRTPSPNSSLLLENRLQSTPSPLCKLASRFLLSALLYLFGGGTYRDHKSGRNFTHFKVTAPHRTAETSGKVAGGTTRALTLTTNKSQAHRKPRHTHSEHLGQCRQLAGVPQLELELAKFVHTTPKSEIITPKNTLAWLLCR